MAIVDPQALERVLSSIDLQLARSRRETLAAGELLPIERDAVTLIYVLSGHVGGHPWSASGCRLDVDRVSRRVSVNADGAAERLHAGDVFLTLGGEGFAIEATSDARIVVVDVEFADALSPWVAALPRYITLTGFDALEPAAAALAQNLGPTAAPDAVTPPPAAEAQSDTLICRLMVTTVVLSVIRAWAARGCAPEGWPSVSQDPFLDRVVEAIHEEPGREWTVERLAGVGAMSRSVFAERFRTVLGRSPADYVAEVRIDQAKRMLDAGRSVSETSRELGYTSDEGFSRAFRRRTGLTPSVWRTRRQRARFDSPNSAAPARSAIAATA